MLYKRYTIIERISLIKYYHSIQSLNNNNDKNKHDNNDYLTILNEIKIHNNQ